MIDNVYINPETGVLRNKYDIDREDLLENAATILSRNAEAHIRALPVLKINGWNADTLKELHRTLFSKIYEWAGQYRTVDVAVSYDHTAYEPPENISKKIDAVFDYINERNAFKDKSYGEKVRDISLVYGNLKNLQPFRDGNTRTALLLTDMLARNCGVYLDYTMIGSTENDRERFGKAQIAARDGNPNPLLDEFMAISYSAKEKDFIDKEHLQHMHMPKIVVDGKKHSFTKQIKIHEEKEKSRSLAS